MKFKRLKLKLKKKFGERGEHGREMKRKKKIGGTNSFYDLLTRSTTDV